MILERYILREISAPLVAICAVLIMIFAGHSAVRFLNDAVNGLLSGGTVVALVALKVLIALEVLLPVTLYLAIVLALSRLYADSEITAMEAAGICQGRIIIPILFLALLLAVMVTGLSLFARPWAYKKIYELETGVRMNSTSPRSRPAGSTSWVTIWSSLPKALPVQDISRQCLDMGSHLGKEEGDQCRERLPAKRSGAGAKGDRLRERLPPRLESEDGH